MMIKKTLTILAVSCMMYSCATKTESNPFFTEFQTEYGVPSFDKIKLEHYEPAFLKGIEEQNQNIEAIIESPEIPTFENTIVALDNSAPILDRVSIIFFNMTDAETTDSLTALSIKLAPVLSEHNDNISLNGKLFKRVNDVYQKKDSLNLTSEQERLLDKTYKRFIRSGANLGEKDQTRLREINKELSTLGITFSNNVLNENNAFQLFVDKEEDLAGLPEWFRQSAAEEAKAAGQPGKWLFTLHNASRLPFLQYSENRPLREQIYKAYINRGNNNDGNDNKENIRKIVSPVLAHEKNSYIYYIDFSFDTMKLGGSALAQVLNKLGNEVPTVKDSEYFADAFNAVQDAIEKGLVLAGHDISAGGMITALLEMCFANVEGGMEINLDKIKEQDLIKILFAENPGIVIQVSDKHKEAVKQILEDAGVGYVKLGKPTDERHILVSKGDATYQFGIDYMRDVWYSTSYLLDRKQSMNGCAKKRFENYKMQPVEFAFMPDFKGKFSQYGIDPDRRTPSGIRAAIIREKGTNGEREMAYSLYLAGFDVKDVTMTDLISGRETLEDVNMIVYCGGFSNSDVLGSAKGWAGAFLFNPKAKEALDKYYAREDTLSLGVCNGCQLMMELNLINPEHKKNGKMLHNDSHKFESRFLGVTVPTNRSVMLGSLSGSKLGIWVAHGEGKFSLPYDEDKYNVVLKYSYDEYPSNPNGSDYSIAGLASADGRHLAMMPHLERAIFPWQNGCYPADRVNSDQITPWVEAFVNARKWVEANKK